jgi:microcystin-dependent protein
MSSITQTISELSTPPSRTDPTNFDNRADQFLSELPDLVSEINAWAGEVNAVIVQVSADTPAGAVQMFAMSTPPAGWLECDGSDVSRTTYATLYAAIGEVYGDGDGSTTFTLPDLRGEFVRGWDNGRGVDSGRELGSSQSDEIKSHRHDQDAGEYYAVRVGSGNQRFSNDGTIDYSHRQKGPYFGGDETRPRNVAMMYAIKY